MHGRPIPEEITDCSDGFRMIPHDVRFHTGLLLALLDEALEDRHATRYPASNTVIQPARPPDVVIQLRNL